MNIKIIAQASAAAAIALSIGACPAFAAEEPASGASNPTPLYAQVSPDLETQAFASKVKFSNVKTAKNYTSAKWDVNAREYKAKAGGATYSTYGSNTMYGYTLQVKFGGDTRTIAYGVDPFFVTNGRYVVFAIGMTPVDGGHTQNGYHYTYNTYKANIYRYDIKTGSRKLIAKGTDWRVFGANAKYIFCGKATTSITKGSLYAVRVKDLKKKKLASASPAQMVCKNGRVIYTSFRMQVGCSKLYTCKVNGTSKKKIETYADKLRVSGSKLIYLKAKYSSGSAKYRVYQCKLNGKSKKAVSGWTTDYNRLVSKCKLD